MAAATWPTLRVCVHETPRDQQRRGGALQTLAVLLIVFAGGPCVAQDQPASSTTSHPETSPPFATQPRTNQALEPAGGDTGDVFSFKRILSRYEFWLTLLILLFGLAVIVCEYVLLKKQSFNGDDILRVFGVTLIIVGSLVLIAAGFGDKQIAPAMGLFGTLAGYLLGKASGAKGSGEHLPEGKTNE